jgi:MYXO-CTERM domain-containing protein
MKLRVALACSLLLVPLVARATTTSCTGASDGTPCSDTCIVVGTCMNQICVPSLLRPDGTPCSSNNPCTVSDQCMAGMCIPGMMRVCPDQDACHVGVCDSHVGCFFKDVCPPDLAGVDLSGSDLGGVDGGEPVDLMSTDLCTIPPGSEFFTCGPPPDGFFFGIDASIGLNPPYHVRGSRVGDCAMSGSALGAPIGAFLLFGLVALALRRRRNLRDEPPGR